MITASWYIGYNVLVCSMADHSFLGLVESNQRL